MNYRAVLTMISLLLLGRRAWAADVANVRVQVAVPAGARAFYSLPGTPAAHPADGMVSLTVAPPVRGPFTFWATAPGCLPVFRHLDREALLRQAGDGKGKRGMEGKEGTEGEKEGLALTPIPFDASVLDTLVNRPHLYTLLPVQEFFAEGPMVCSPDARGMAVSGTIRVMDPFRKIDRMETEVWWCPLPPARPVRVAWFFPPQEASFYFVSNLAISPDGEYLAYSQGQGEQEDLHLYNLFTGERRVAAADPRWSEYFPAWSPDGRQLAYIAEKKGGTSEAEEGYAVRLTRWDGQENRLVAAQACGVCPAFSPDGQWLAYACADSLKVCELRTRQHRKIVTGVQPFGEHGPALHWSPDGQWIAFVGVPAHPLERYFSGGMEHGGPYFVYLVHPSQTAAETAALPNQTAAETAALPNQTAAETAALPSPEVRRLTRARANLAWLPDYRLWVNGITRWDVEKGSYTGAVIVDVSGQEVQDLAISQTGGSDTVAGSWDPWLSFTLPPLPTLPETAVSMIREGRNW